MRVPATLTLGLARVDLPDLAGRGETTVVQSPAFNVFLSVTLIHNLGAFCTLLLTRSIHVAHAARDRDARRRYS